MTNNSRDEEAIFSAARQIVELDARVAYLAKACAGDETLRARVQALLKAHDEQQNFLQSDATSERDLSLNVPNLVLPPGTMIGRYKLLEQIGGGGMGVVYMAEQVHPVRRKVALKIIKPGMDSGQVIARFEAERQALSMMDHPNIAKVLDAGTTDAGRPYFVMELVKGIPITDYCDQAKLTTRERLELFMQVCHAVQHAHQKGVIHRDLKPSNVLVTLHDDKPVPKVIDFGIAKAAGQILTEKTLFTNYAQLLGTPLYMSPEQAQISGLDVDTRSDVYSLGVLLYELLTGTTPFDKKRLREAAYDEMRRIIREEDPPKPSTRLSSMGEKVAAVSADRHTDAKKLGQLVRGELDWIVMKSLEKDRTRRYETANGLARDVERHLHDEAVLACPPSGLYRFRKFARRNKVGLLVASAALATLLVLVVGLAVSNRLIARERNQKATALMEKEQALAAAEAQSHRAEQGFLRASIAIREVMTKAAMGTGEWSQLPPPLRKRFAEEAIKFYEGLLQESNPDPSLRYETAVGYRSIGAMHTTSGELPQAEASFRHSIAILERVVSERPANPQYRQQLAYSLLNLGRTLRNTKRSDEAKAALHKGAELYETLISHNPNSSDFRTELATCCLELSLCHVQSRDSKPAADAVRRGIAVLETAVPMQPDVPQDQEQLARLHLALGDLCAGDGQIKEAKAAFRAGAERYEDAFSKRQSASILYNWVMCYGGLINLPNDDRQTRKAETEQAYREIFKIRSRIPADLAANRELRERFGYVHRGWAYYLWSAGRLQEAEQTYVEAVTICDKLTIDEPDIGKYWPLAADTHRELAKLMMLRGRPQEAEQELLRSIEQQKHRAARFPDEPAGDDRSAPRYLDIARLLIKARSLAEAGKQDEGADAYTRGGDAFLGLGQWNLAIASYSKAIESGPKLAAAWNGRGWAHMQFNHLDKALADYNQAIELDPKQAKYWNNRSITYLRLNKPDDALTDCAKAIEVDPKFAPAWLSRGFACLLLHQSEKSVDASLKALGLRTLPEGDVPVCFTNLAVALDDWARQSMTAGDPNSPPPDRLTESAQKAAEFSGALIELVPQSAEIWLRLGSVRYRAGDWNGSVEALRRSIELDENPKGGESAQWFFLAMAYWRLDNKDEARRWYEQAVQWTEKNRPKDEERLRFRAEAGQLLQIIHQQPTTKLKSQ